MSDSEKVIRGIKQCLMSCETDEYETQCEDCPYFDPDATVRECKQVLLRDALALLKEQEAIKPIRHENWWECPSCGKNIFANMKYCYGCGKAVKWDDNGQDNQSPAGLGGTDPDAGEAQTADRSR